MTSPGPSFTQLIHHPHPQGATCTHSRSGGGHSSAWPSRVLVRSRTHQGHSLQGNLGSHSSWLVTRAIRIQQVHLDTASEVSKSEAKELLVRRLGDPQCVHRDMCPSFITYERQIGMTFLQDILGINYTKLVKGILLDWVHFAKIDIDQSVTWVIKMSRSG